MAELEVYKFRLALPHLHTGLRFKTEYTREDQWSWPGAAVVQWTATRQPGGRGKGVKIEFHVLRRG